MKHFKTALLATTLILPTVAVGSEGMSVKLMVHDDLDKSVVEAIGSVSHVITDEEREAFDLEDDDLKVMVSWRNMLNGQLPTLPNDAFVKGPTPWNDLYKTYNWDQVKVVWTPVSAEIISAESVPFVVDVETLSNDASNSEPLIVKGQLSQVLSNGIQWSWESSAGKSASVSAEVEVEVGFLGKGAKAKAGGSTTITSNFSKGGSETLSKSIASTASLQQNLNPGKSVEFVMTASQGNLQARVVYEQTLTGNVAVNYNPKFNGHHFYAIPVNSLLKARQQMTFQEFKPKRLTQVFNIDNYTNITARAVAKN